MSRCWNIASQLAGITLLCAAWSASAQADQVQDCVQGTDVPGYDAAGVDWRRMVAGCSGIIDSGRWDGARLAWAHNNRGHAYRHLGQHGPAIADYTRALELDPAHVNAYVNRAVSRDQTGDHAGAIADYNSALRLDPSREYAKIGRSFAQNALAWDHYLSGQPADGLALIEAALAQDRSNPDFLDTRAHILAALGRTDAALETFEAAAAAGNADLIRDYQQALQRHGLDPGPVDGAYGGATRTALAACVQSGCRLLDGPAAGTGPVVASVDVAPPSGTAAGPQPRPAAGVALPALSPFHADASGLPQFAPAQRLPENMLVADVAADTDVSIADLLVRADSIGQANNPGGDFPAPPALAPWGPSPAQVIASSGPSDIPTLEWNGVPSQPDVPPTPALAPANRAPIVGISEL